MDRQLGRFQGAVAVGALGLAFKLGEQLLQNVTSEQLRKYIYDTLVYVSQEAQRRGFRRRVERYARLPNRYNPDHPLSYDMPRQLPPMPEQPRLTGGKRGRDDGDHRGSGPSRTEQDKYVVSSAPKITDVTIAQEGICICPSKTYGTQRSHDWYLQQKILQDRLRKTVGRFQSLSTPTVAADIVDGLSYGLNYWSVTGTNDTVLPFYVYRCDVVPQCQIFNSLSSGDILDNARPKVCFRLHMRSDYSYDEDNIKPMFYWKPWDADVQLNAPDAATDATRNNYKIEYSTQSITGYPAIKDYVLNWVEAQILLRQSVNQSRTDLATVHTGFMKFPACCEPPKAWYYADFQSRQLSNTMTADEACAHDNFFLRMFNKKLTHPLMRSGGGFTKMKPVFFNSQRHCLNAAATARTMQASVRYNVGSVVSTTDYGDTMQNTGSQISLTFPKYLQVSPGSGFDAFPEFGKGLWFYVYTGELGLPNEGAPPHTAHPSFDIMIRNCTTTGI